MNLYSYPKDNNAICLNSMIYLEDIDSGEAFHFRLVSSDIMNTDGDQLSIVSSLGNALIGKKSGSIVHWYAPSRLRRFMIKSFF